MDNLTNIFKYSSDNVIITDYKFNILWSNKEGKIFLNCGSNCKDLFKDYELPLQSDIYYIKCGVLIHECTVLNYPDYSNGVYVIQIKENNTVYSAARCKGLREIIINQAAALRSAVSGINTSSHMLGLSLDEAEMYDEQKYLDITTENCCKLLNIFSGMIELIQYGNGNITKQPIDLSAALEEFILVSSNVLRNKIQFKKNIAPNLCIETDCERFEYFIAAMVLLANSGNQENNIINITAECSAGFVSITIMPDSNGVDYTEPKHTKHTKMYKDDEYDINLIIADRFCNEFNGTLFVSDDKVRSYNVRIPCYTQTPPTIFKSSSKRYGEDIFSKYRCIYSDLLY